MNSDREINTMEELAIHVQQQVQVRSAPMDAETDPVVRIAESRRRMQERWGSRSTTTAS